MRKPFEVLVTGSTGFIGSHLVSKLKKEGYSVLEANHSNDFDVTRAEVVLNLPPSDVVIHLAAIVNVPLSWEIPEDTLKVNINGTLNMLRYCEKNKARMIYASSYAYGIPKYFPIDEKHPVSAENPYAVSKLAAEQLCYVYGKKSGFETTVLRIFNPYGPGQSDKMVISNMISGLIKEGKITIFNGKPKRDFLFVEDLVDVYLKIIKNSQEGGKIYNIGFGESWSIKEIADLLIKISGKKVEIEDKKMERSNEIMDTVADISLVKRELGWTPKIGIREGLEKTFKWYSSQHDKERK